METDAARGGQDGLSNNEHSDDGGVDSDDDGDGNDLSV